jgi:D-glycero-alpha-D-manno-heptose-7-phosphate kinase
VGGGTDYPQWYLKEGGAVLSTTIDKYCYISCRFLPPFFNIKHRVVWSHIETVGSVSEILHPAVREGMRYLKFDDSVGLEIHHQGDLPARGGTGSSSSFSVGLINALMGLRGKRIGKHDLALGAIELERDWLKESVGAQDQVAAAYGGLNVIRFDTSGKIDVQPIQADEKRIETLDSKLMLFYAGENRLSSERAKQIIDNIPAREANLRQMRDMVDRAAGVLEGDGDLDEFGHLMHENWMLKRELSAGVSTESIDGIYDKAMNSGALGGKLMGAGGTGFMAFYVNEEQQPAVRAALSNYLHVPFRFENEGSSLVYSASEISAD